MAPIAVMVVKDPPVLHAMSFKATVGNGCGPMNSKMYAPLEFNVINSELGTWSLNLPTA